MSVPQTFAEREAAARRSFGAALATLFLYLLPAPLLGKAFVELVGHGRYGAFAISLALFALFVFGATLVRRGMRDALEFASRKVAHARGTPLKTMGGVVMGAASALTGWLAAGLGPGVSIAVGLGAWLGVFLAFGPDPRGAKGIAADAGVSAAELSSALGEARAKLMAIEAGAKRIAGATAYALREKLRNVVGAANKVLLQIEEDPRDLRRARKFLNVYLDGAQRVTETYAATSARASSPEMEARFAALLDDMEKTFTEQHAKLLENDTLDLDAEIEVLKTRLTREGLS